jgi:hypothetical protein
LIVVFKDDDEEFLRFFKDKFLSREISFESFSKDINGLIIIVIAEDD